MPTRRFLLIALVLAAVALQPVRGGGTYGRLQLEQATAARLSVAALRLCTGCLSSGGELSRYGYVVMNAWNADRIPALKAANPAIKVLVYKNMIAARTDACRNGADQRLLSTGVGYCWANRNRPAWFLRDADDHRIEFCDYPGVWMMDMGNGSYQETWLANVGAEAKAKGWDGVFIDDANPYQSYHLCARTLARYPSEAEQTAATRSFLARVGPALRSQGLLVLPNIPSTTTAIWSDWLQFSSGAVQEYWSKWGSGYDQQFSGLHWAERQQFLKLTQQAGKVFLALTYAPSDDLRSMRYARASFLLDWDGGASAFVFEPGGGAHPRSPEWRLEIGKPLGHKRQVDGAWIRTFTGGLVAVNPSPTAPTTISLPRTYRLHDGSPVTSVTLPPTSGITLRGGNESLHSARVARTVPYPRGEAFWRWLAWYVGEGEYKQRGRKAATRPNVGSPVPARWWHALDSFVAARSA